MENCLQGVRPLTLCVQKQVEGGFFHRYFFAFPEASQLSRLLMQKVVPCNEILNEAVKMGKMF